MLRSRTLAALLLGPLAPLALRAQDAMAAMAGMADVHHHAPAPASAAVRRQIDSVARAVASLGTPAAAAAAGLAPVFGWIPTMGVHWVDRATMTKAAQSDRAHPGQLMFSRVAGRDSLVGVAYGYFASVGDTVTPALFAGAPRWHEHPDRAPAGETLVMLHVWFVASPDGPFAGTNPNLPFWALGLAAPDAARMHDPAFGGVVRRAALALAELADSTAIFPQVKDRPDVAPMLAARRDSIRTLVTELRAAERAKDATRWDRAAERAAAQWDALYATYLASARTAAGKERMQRYVAMLLGQHGE